MKNDWAEEVEHELYNQQRNPNKYPTSKLAQENGIRPEDIQQCHECKEYLDDYFRHTYCLFDNTITGACNECMTTKKLNLPACAVCEYRNEAKHMYITGSFDKRYFCTYEEQCIYWFNQGGWQNNKRTI